MKHQTIIALVLTAICLSLPVFLAVRSAHRTDQIDKCTDVVWWTNYKTTREWSRKAAEKICEQKVDNGEQF